MKLVIIILIATLFIFSGYTKELAITFDDSPRFARGHLDGQTRAKKLIQALKDSGVEQVAFFSVSANLDSEGRERLNLYSNAGHLIANHTHTHPDFNDSSFESYKNDFLQAHDELSKFKTFIKLFRFPYLREGDEKIKRDNMRLLLSEMGYQNGYVTLANSDWFMENLFQDAVKNNKYFDFNKMKNFYVQILMDDINYYDQMAIKILGRSPKHILLLHETDIWNESHNLDYLTEHFNKDVL